MPKFGTYLSAVFIGICGVVLFTLVFLLVWFLGIVLGVISESADEKGMTSATIWILGSMLSFAVAARFSFNVDKADLSCSACSASWTVQPTGKSQVLDTEEIWRQEERTEKKYKGDLKPSGWYARSVFLDVLYEVKSLEDSYKCSNCSTVTKRPRTEEGKLREEVRSATPWQPAQSDVEIGAKIGRKMV